MNDEEEPPKKHEHVHQEEPQIPEQAEEDDEDAPPPPTKGNMRYQQPPKKPTHRPQPSISKVEISSHKQPEKTSHESKNPKNETQHNPHPHFNQHSFRPLDPEDDIPPIRVTPSDKDNKKSEEQHARHEQRPHTSYEANPKSAFLSTQESPLSRPHHMPHRSEDICKDYSLNFLINKSQVKISEKEETLHFMQHIRE